MAATAVFLVTVPLHRDWFDVGVYYGTVNDWIHGGGRIYDYLRPGTHYGFTYPPFAAVCMLPMALVGWPVAVAVSIGLSAAAAALLLHWLAGPAIRRAGWCGWFAFTVAGCLFALLEPVRDTVSFGQVNLVLVALVFADARLLTAARDGDDGRGGSRGSGSSPGSGGSRGAEGLAPEPSAPGGLLDAQGQRRIGLDAAQGLLVGGEPEGVDPGSGGGDGRGGHLGGDRHRGRPLAARLARCAGVGIGLATAIKLTPALFIGYLLVTRRWRAACVAVATAAAATLLAARIAPGASRTYWTEALWDTDRIGSLGYVSNQSLQGVLARLQPGEPERAAWLLCVLAVLAVWAWRARRAAADGDEWAGFALTGLAACLVSPITWVHHLVWAVPALALLADTALRRGRRPLLGASCGLYVLLCSSVVWLWRWNSTGVGAFLGANLYVWITLGLLIALPGRERDRDRGGAPDPRLRTAAAPAA
ncbi:glycosyltransferase 87 family protein [Streptomyces pathocidini]|uniref:glycosyltransferase 87 family protein n=1 Tax=Streptomyces pathocidini TaxID=1650571 RepID=UPI001F0B0D7F|nr:glycosyltransferase 87 family protein [Streptomyces pathocidini]